MHCLKQFILARHIILSSVKLLLVKVSRSICLLIFDRELHVNEYLPLLSKQLHQLLTSVFQL